MAIADKAPTGGCRDAGARAAVICLPCPSGAAFCTGSGTSAVDVARKVCGRGRRIYVRWRGMRGTRCLSCAATANGTARESKVQTGVQSNVRAESYLVDSYIMNNTKMYTICALRVLDA